MNTLHDQLLDLMLLACRGSGGLAYECSEEGMQRYMQGLREANTEINRLRLFMLENQRKKQESLMSK